MNQILSHLLAQSTTINLFYVYVYVHHVHMLFQHMNAHQLAPFITLLMPSYFWQPSQNYLSHVLLCFYKLGTKINGRTDKDLHKFCPGVSFLCFSMFTLHWMNISGRDCIAAPYNNCQTKNSRIYVHMKHHVLT